MNQISIPKLFAVYLGGLTQSSQIEVHDVRFVAGNTIDDTFPSLRQEWFGIQKGLHIDAYVEITEVDGFSVTLQPHPSTTLERLFFVNLGGYDPTKFTELHECGFFVGTSVNQVKRRAKVELLTAAKLQHKDDLYDVDQCLELSRVGKLHIHLTPITDSLPKPQALRAPTWFGYRRIDN